MNYSSCKNLMSALAHMDGTETRLKKYYQTHPELFMDHPHEISVYEEIFKDIVPEVNWQKFEPHILERQKEAHVFQEGLDVEFSRFLRYFPVVWHTSIFFNLFIVFSGSAAAYFSDHEISLNPGDVLIIAPETTHAIGVFADDGIIYNFQLRASTFEKAFFGVLSDNDILGDFFNKALMMHASETEYLLFQTGYDEPLFLSLEYIYRETLRNKRYRNRMVNNILDGFFIMLLRNHDSDIILPEKAGAAGNENLLYILQYIQSHYQTVTLSSLSAFFGYSERQLLRLIKSATGKTFRSVIWFSRKK